MFVETRIVFQGGHVSESSIGIFHNFHVNNDCMIVQYLYVYHAASKFY